MNTNLKTKIPFGKFQGKTLQQVLDTKPDYIVWLSKQRITDAALSEVVSTLTFDYVSEYTVSAYTKSAGKALAVAETRMEGETEYVFIYQNKLTK
ncbi:exodeoxyribonuclease X C-terminal domain-containing protein [Aliarcobacter butzleri]|uniref:exodeoxyribonuclease X C-terminal domain-containing protein n=1 Tax=Aliarcobacter butzleri TaxID=28197 RepID=UPI0021B257A7|nr:hypothetical protein [Aliarcobacter butzleri]MCT7596108.1 hypothetical protein [Aliarcobacter butzleri]